MKNQIDKEVAIILRDRHFIQTNPIYVAIKRFFWKSFSFSFGLLLHDFHKKYTINYTFPCIPAEILKYTPFKKIKKNFG
jgi:hypothetical protein